LKKGEVEDLKFEVSPTNLKMMPHEHRYIKVKFKPDIMTQYHAMLVAEVIDGENIPKTQKLQFELKGEGAMPTLRLEKPNVFEGDSLAVLSFPRTHIGKRV